MATQTIKRNVVTKYTLDTTGVTKKLNEISMTAKKSADSLRRIDKATKETAKNTAALNTQLKQFGAYLKFKAIALVSSQLFKLSDAATDSEARIRALATQFESSGTVAESSAKIFEDLYNISIKFGVGVDTLAESYVKLGTAIPTLEHEQLTSALTTTTQVLATTGASTQQVNAVMLQLSQALASGAVQGDEFRSVYENAPVLLYAWQKAAGLTDQGLRDLSASASLTTESFFELLPAIQANITEMVGTQDVPLTFSRALENLRSAVIKLFVDFKSVGGEDPLAPLANGIQNVTGLIADMDTAIYAVSNTFSAIGDVASNVFSVISGGWSVLLGSVGNIADAFLSLGNTITDNKYVVEDWSDLFGYTFEVFIPNLIYSIGPYFKSMIETLHEEVKFGVKVIDESFSLIPPAAEVAWAALKAGFLAAVNALINAAVSGGKKLVNALIRPINKAIYYINTAFKSSISDIELVPAGASKDYAGFEEAALGAAVAQKELDKANRLVAESTADAREAFEKAGASAQKLARSKVEAHRIQLEENRITRIHAEDVTIGARKTDEMAEKTDKLSKAAGGGGGGGGASKAMNDLAKEIEKANKAMRDAENYMKDYIKSLEEQIKMAQMGSKEKAIYRVESELLAKIQDYERKNVEALAKGQNHLAEAYKKSAAMIEENIPKAKELAEQLYELENGTKGFAALWKGAVEDIVGSIEGTLGDAFYNLFNGTMSSAKDMMNGLKEIILKGLANIAAGMAMQPLNVVLGGVTGGAGGAGAGGGIGNLFSGSGIGQSIGAGLGKAFNGASFVGPMADALSKTPNWMFGIGSAIGTVLGTSMGGNALTSGIGSTLGSVAGSALAGSVGSALGATVGSILPGIGTVIGGALGGMIGGMIGGGSKPKQPGAAFNVSGGQIGYSAYQGINAEQGKEIADAIGQLNRQLDALEQVMGPEAAAARAGYSATSSMVSIENAEASLQQHFTDILQHMASSLGGMAREAWDRSGGDIQAFTEIMVQIEQLGGTLALAMNAVTPGTVNNLEEAYAILGRMGLDAIPAFVEGLVGFAQLKESFVTDAERIQAATALVEKTFAELGVVLPTSTIEMKKFIDSLDMSNEHHQNLAAALGTVAPAIALYTESLEQQGAVIGELAPNINLVVRELELLGKNEEALTLRRKDELSKLNEVDRAVQKRIHALEDEAKAAADAAAATDALQNEIQTYVDALVNIQKTLDATRQDITEFGMDPEQIYKRRKEEADRLMDALGEMTDPAMIESTVSQINQLITQGWGLLDDTQKSGLQNSFLDYLNDIERVAEERLAIGLAPLLPEAEVSFEGTMVKFSELMNNLDGSLAASSKGFENSTAEMREAAREMVAAASEMSSAAKSIPTTLSVSVRDHEVS